MDPFRQDTKASIVVCFKQFALLHCSVSNNSSVWQIEAVNWSRFVNKRSRAVLPVQLPADM